MAKAAVMIILSDLWLMNILNWIGKFSGSDEMISSECWSAGDEDIVLMLMWWRKPQIK